jgi:hypothetical protein
MSYGLLGETQRQGLGLTHALRRSGRTLRRYLAPARWRMRAISFGLELIASARENSLTVARHRLALTESDWLMPPIDGSENVVDALFNFGHGGFLARCQSA